MIKNQNTISIRAFAAKINVSEKAVRNAIATGKIKKGVIYETIQVPRIIEDIALTEYGTIKERMTLPEKLVLENTISIRAFAAKIKISEKTVRNAIATGKIKKGVIYDPRIVGGEIIQMPMIIEDIAKTEYLPRKKKAAE